MTSYYWIKLYHEILDDPKMALLPDRLWRRVVELFVLAGRHGKDGLLPDTRSLAWELRMSLDDLEMDMKQIETTGIVEHVTNGWLVVNYTKRQEAVSGAKRTQQFRSRQKKQEYYQEDNTSETQVKRDVTQNRTEQNRVEVDKGAATAKLYKSYEGNIGAITDTAANEIASLLEDYPSEWIEETFQLAALNNKRSLNYAEAILKRWEREGKDDGKQKQSASTKGYTHA